MAVSSFAKPFLSLYARIRLKLHTQKPVFSDSCQSSERGVRTLKSAGEFLFRFNDTRTCSLQRLFGVTTENNVGTKLPIAIKLHSKFVNSLKLKTASKKAWYKNHVLSTLALS